MPSTVAHDQRLQAERLRSAELRRQREHELDAHVQAIKTARADLESKIRELQGHLDGLQHVSRRLGATEDGDVGRYRVYATAHVRLAGAMGQALKRAQATDRLLEATREQREAREQQEREESMRERVDAAVQDVFDLQLPKEDDFELLFGEAVTDGP